MLCAQDVLLAALVTGAIIIGLASLVAHRILTAARKKAESIERGATRLAQDAVAAWEATHGKRHRATMLPPR